MKLGHVFAKERTNRRLTASFVADRLGLSREGYAVLELGESKAEECGPLLAAIAVAFGVPAFQLIDGTGDAGAFGAAVRRHRERQEKSVVDMAGCLGVSTATYEALEAGKSELEAMAPLFLGFAELVKQPVFNLFYPCGIAFTELDDYP